MALHYSFENMKDREAFLAQPNFVTDSLIWATIPIGINAITEANADEVFARLRVMEVIWGPTFVIDGEKTGYTPEMVRDHIGMTTNASEKTRTVFLNDMKRELGRHATASAREYSGSIKLPSA